MVTKQMNRFYIPLDHSDTYKDGSAILVTPVSSREAATITLTGLREGFGAVTTLLRWEFLPQTRGLAK